jgi:hypothetical protein
VRPLTPPYIDHCSRSLLNSIKSRILKVGRALAVNAKYMQRITIGWRGCTIPNLTSLRSLSTITLSCWRSTDPLSVQGPLEAPKWPSVINLIIRSTTSRTKEKAGKHITIPEGAAKIIRFTLIRTPAAETTRSLQSKEVGEAVSSIPPPSRRAAEAPHLKGRNIR